MKSKFTILSILITLFLFSCSTPSVKIKKFQGRADTIMVKGETHLEWEVENSDSIFIKQLGFDKLILELAAPKSRMLVSPSFNADYELIAFGKDSTAKAHFNLVVIDTVKTLVDTIVVVKPIPPEEPNNTKSKFVKGITSYENSNSDFKVDIFFIDKISYPREIKLYITVKDANGNFITNLAPPYGTRKKSEEFFKNLVTIVNGKEKKISDFTVEERHDTLVQKYSYSLVLDHSGSMYDDIDNLQNAVKHFIKMMNPTDAASIIKFDQNIVESVKLTTDKNVLLNPNLYNGLEGFGGLTSLIGAGDLGLYSLRGAKNTKVELLFTDGYENSSLIRAIAYNDGLAYKTSQLIYNAREEGVKIITIGYGEVDEELLEKISILTDGKAYYANNGKEILDIFEELPRILSNYYMITYTPIKEDGEHEIILTYKNKNGNDDITKRKTFIGKLDLNDLDKNEPQCIAFFDFNKDVLKDEFIPVIKNIAEFLTKYPKSTLEIHGHTDLTGTKAANLAISKRRAEAVAKIFVENGIDKSKIKIIAHGAENPVFKNESTEYEKEQNRRVEFVIKD